MPLSRREFAAALGFLPLIAVASPPVAAAGGAFERWLAALRAEARRRGIREATLARALTGLEPLPEVIELDRRQPEGRLSFAEYRRRVVSADRVRRGSRLRRRHRRILAATTARYGVPDRILVALWGIESSFGHVRGRFNVVAALATLAFEGRRAAFFRKELLAALEILDRGDIAIEEMYGSWAGAMGQPQFMPSTFLAHAVDADGDGRRDIWNSLPDVFASMANYLRRSGWDRRYRWGREVRLTRPVGKGRVGLEHRAPLARWAARGVRRLDGRPLPAVAIDASLLLPDGPGGPAFLVYDNYRVLLRWNRSHYFALSVGLLSDAIRARPA